MGARATRARAQVPGPRQLTCVSNFLSSQGARPALPPAVRGWDQFGEQQAHGGGVPEQEGWESFWD